MPLRVAFLIDAVQRVLVRVEEGLGLVMQRGAANEAVPADAYHPSAVLLCSSIDRTAVARVQDNIYW